MHKYICVASTDLIHHKIHHYKAPIDLICTRYLPALQPDKAKKKEVLSHFIYIVISKLILKIQAKKRKTKNQNPMNVLEMKGEEILRTTECKSRFGFCLKRLQVSQTNQEIKLTGLLKNKKNSWENGVAINDQPAAATPKAMLSKNYYLSSTAVVCNTQRLTTLILVELQHCMGTRIKARASPSILMFSSFCLQGPTAMQLEASKACNGFLSGRWFWRHILLNRVIIITKRVFFHPFLFYTELWAASQFLVQFKQICQKSSNMYFKINERGCLFLPEEKEPPSH